MGRPKLYKLSKYEQEEHITRRIDENNNLRTKIDIITNINNILRYMIILQSMSPSSSEGSAPQ